MSFASVLQRLEKLENPYPGLRPFDTSEAHLFFGRDQQISELVARLERNCFVAVVGVSGSGKSSLVNAGLIPALQHGRVTDSRARWRIVVSRPAGAPFANLAGKLSEAGLDPTPLPQSSYGLVHVARQLPTDESLLVVVDQFEELFRYKDLQPVTEEARRRHEQAAAEAYEFVQILLAASRYQPPVYVVITMRSDYLGDCAEFRDLPEALNECQYLIPRLTRDQRRLAIECPLGATEISSALVQRMLNDAGDEPDQLPILQHALMRTWSQWRKSDFGQSRKIELQDYEVVGGFQNALDQHADDLLSTVSSDIATSIFKRLTARGRNQRERRDPARLAEIWELCGAKTQQERDQVNAVIDHFRQQESTFLLPREGHLGPDTYIDIAHESLIRQWKILRDQWLPEESKAASTFLDLVARARNRRMRRGELLNGLDLTDALEWDRRRNPTATWARHYADESALSDVVEFIEASEAEEKQRERRRKRNFWVAIAACVVFALLAVVAVVEWYRAKNAQKGLETANKNLVKAQEGLETANKNLIKTQEGLKTANTNLTCERDRARKAEREAKDSAAIAKKQTSRAEHEARRNRSHELAVASLDKLQSDQELSLLLSLESVEITYKIDKTAEPEAEEALQRAVQASQSKVFSSGHTAEIHALAFSPDRKRMATAGFDGTARVWDAASGLCLLTLSGHTGTVWSVAFSPDGRHLATAGDDHTVRIWDANSGEQVRSLPHDSPVWSVAFSPNGSHLATGSQDGTAEIWDLVDTSVIPLIFSGHKDAVRAVAFSPDQEHLGTASQDGTAKVWLADHPEKAPVTFSAKDSAPAPVNALAFSPDKVHLATVGDDKKVSIWDTRDVTKPPGGFELGIKPVWAVAYSPDGKYLATSGLATSGNSRKATIWDLSNPSHSVEMTIPQSHRGTVWAIAFSPDGRRVGTAGGNDLIARVWDASSGRELLELSDVSVKESVLALSTDGKFVAANGNDGRLRLWDGVSGLELFSLLPKTDTKRLAAFGPGGQYLGAISDGIAHVWETDGGQEVHRFQVGDGVPTALAVSPDGGRLATIIGNVLTVWDVSAGSALPRAWNSTPAATLVAFSPDGRLLATIAGQKVKLWDIQSGAGQDLSHARVRAVTFSLDSKHLATASLDNTVRLWNTQSGEELRSLQFQANGVYDIAFNPKGDKIAALTREGSPSLRLWQVGNPEEKLSLPVGFGQRLAFHPDGDLITADNGMVIREYPLSDPELITFARRLLRRSWTADECHHYLSLREEDCHTMMDALESIADGNDLARVGKDSAAMACFRKAQKLDPSLQFDAEEEIRGLRVEGLLASGRNLASVGDWNDALANFQKARELDPELNINPQEAARHLASPALVGKGSNLARAGDLDGAIGSFRQAKELDPGLNLDPEMDAKRLFAQGIAAKGIILARSGDIDGARKTFKEAKSLYPNDPDRTKKETDALQEVAKALWRDASFKAKVNLDLAVQTYEKASDLHRSLQFDPESQAERVKALNSLCWQGSVGRQAARVIDYCELAVQFSGTNNWDIRDSRGLARALTGRKAGAIEDFQFFIDHTDQADRKAQRQKWIAALNQGANPFTPEELETLRDQ